MVQDEPDGHRRTQVDGASELERPPATLLALCKARDRGAAADKVATKGMFPYDIATLIERGELVDRSMVASPREDLSE